METRKVISNKNLAPKSPILTGIVAYLFLEHINAHGYVYGIVGTILWLWLVIWISYKFNTVEYDIFEDKKAPVKESFKDKIERKDL